MIFGSAERWGLFMCRKDKYQVVIPKRIRKRLALYPGERIEALEYENRIEFVPVKDIKKCAVF